MDTTYEKRLTKMHDDNANIECKHLERHIETIQVDYFVTPDIDESYEREVYVCDSCGITLDGDPEVDRAEALEE